MKIVYTPEAVNDLKRLRQFIAEKNPTAVQRIANELLERIAQLEQLPYLGRKVYEAPDPEMVRDLSVGMYIVRYLVQEHELHILRIWHKRENWAN